MPTPTATLHKPRAGHSLPPPPAEHDSIHPPPRRSVHVAHNVPAGRPELTFPGPPRMAQDVAIVTGRRAHYDSSSIMARPPEAVVYSEETKDPQLKHLRVEISNVVTEAARQARSAKRWAAFWNSAYIALGLPGAVLAALSAAVGLSSQSARIPAAVLALIAASLTAAAGFLRSDARALSNRQRSSAWLALEADARWIAALEGYRTASALANGWVRLLNRRKLILAGNYEAAFNASKGGPIKFAGEMSTKGLDEGKGQKDDTD